ncbi:hypothetical protein ElyMa_000074300 [Elysia marginata]|uniref:Uncharacterized protein n=1 Tax=Elysia marginata TaxID=1093978 RepID=A0AAV4EHG1_9GAST|nr:hypothetical protein ElyMa_000074300 [Elysia marginata]
MNSIFMPAILAPLTDGQANYIIRSSPLRCGWGLAPLRAKSNGKLAVMQLPIASILRKKLSTPSPSRANLIMVMLGEAESTAEDWVIGNSFGI